MRSYEYGVYGKADSTCDRPDSEDDCIDIGYDNSLKPTEEEGDADNE